MRRPSHLVPFPFVVGNQTLPAGTYQVQRLLGQPVEADQVGMVVIRGIVSHELADASHEEVALAALRYVVALRVPARSTKDLVTIKP